QALEWGIQIAEGLAAAHQRGIVHRDLKPENGFLTRAGHVKSLDSGTARAAPAAPEPRGLLEPTLSPAGYETQTGAVLGTPGYMSPEQVRVEAVDARSDLFAAGSILYELVRAPRAFPGWMVESGHALLHDDPAPLPESVAPPISRVVQRCLAKDPEQRFQSARDLGVALRAGQAPRAALPARARLGVRARCGPWAHRPHAGAGGRAGPPAVAATGARAPRDCAPGRGAGEPAVPAGAADPAGPDADLPARLRPRRAGRAGGAEG